MQLSDIQADIYFKGKINSTTYNSTDLLRSINTYYKIAQEGIRAINEGFYTKSYYFTLTASSSASPGIYNFPTDMEKMKKLYAALTPVNVNSPLWTEYQPVTIVDWSAITDPSYSFGKPTAVIYDTTFELFPYLTNTASTPYPVTNGLRLLYIQRQADLANASDVPNLLNDYHDVICWGTLMDVANRKGDKDMLKLATDMWTSRTEAMKRNAAGRILDSEPAYVEGQPQAGGWSFGWGKSTI